MTPYLSFSIIFCVTALTNAANPIPNDPKKKTIIRLAVQMILILILLILAFVFYHIHEITITDEG
jgi:hypothetical protein